jgi:cobalt/nickel transport system permease protein
MHHDFLDKYSDLDTPLHRLDARVKMLSSVALLVAIVVTPPRQPAEFLLFALLLSLLTLISRVPVLHIVKKSLILFPFVLLVAIFLPFMKGGTALWEGRFVVPLRITHEGISIFLNVVCKAYLALTTMILLSATTPFIQILHAMQALRVPRLVIMILSFMYRYIFLLIDEAERMLTALEARRFGLRRRRKLTSFGQLVGVLFLRTYERGERIYQAMTSRGFDGTVHVIAHPRVTTGDVLLAALFLTLLAIIKVLGALFYV